MAAYHRLEDIAPLNRLDHAEVGRLHVPELLGPYLIRPSILRQSHDGRDVRASDSAAALLEPFVAPVAPDEVEDTPLSYDRHYSSPLRTSLTISRTTFFASAMASSSSRSPITPRCALETQS